MSIRINGKKYRNGTIVRANPVEEATGTLEKIGIGSDVYEIQGGGGGSSGVYVEDELYTATSNSFVDITVDWEWKDYDLYIFRVHDTYSENGDITTLTKGQISSMVSSGNHQYFFRFGSSNCSYVFTSSQLTARANGDGLFIEQIVGIKVSGDYYSPVIYSTKEREIGVWTDNKPLYEKTVLYNNAMTYRTWVRVVDETDITIVDHEGLVYLDGEPYCEIDYYRGADSSEYVCSGIANKSVIQIYQSFSGLTVTCRVTYRYTKDSDTAGSGSYNTLGVPMVHYTTDEQVIGTWIDGKPLYERSYSFTNTRSSFTDYVTLYNIPNIETVVKNTFTALRDLGQNEKLHYTGEGTARPEHDTSYYINIREYNGDIQYRINGYGTQITEMVITTQYTKTTD